MSLHRDSDIAIVQVGPRGCADVPSDRPTGIRARVRSLMSKKYLVTPTERERAALGQRVSAGHGRARELIHPASC